jgi:hypothetical protein
LVVAIVGKLVHSTVKTLEGQRSAFKTKAMVERQISSLGGFGEFLYLIQTREDKAGLYMCVLGTL